MPWPPGLSQGRKGGTKGGSRESGKEGSKQTRKEEIRKVDKLSSGPDHLVTTAPRRVVAFDSRKATKAQRRSSIACRKPSETRMLGHLRGQLGKNLVNSQSLPPKKTTRCGLRPPSSAAFSLSRVFPQELLQDLYQSFQDPARALCCKWGGCPPFCLSRAALSRNNARPLLLLSEQNI